MKIHSTAIVDPKAKIGIEVEIGPYAVIGPAVIIGARSTIESHAVIENEVTIGEANFIGHAAIIGAAPQDLSFSPDRRTRIEIGDKNIIREHCTVHRGSADGSVTKIGSNNFLMAGAHVGHNCEIGNHVIVANNCLLGGHVRVDDGAFLGGGCVFHQHMHVGRLAIAQGASAFSKDIPPFAIAAERNYVFGLNVVGLRRAGFGGEDRTEIKEAFQLVYSSGLNISQALEKSKTMTFGKAAREFLDFIALAKKRGVCAYHRHDEKEDQET